MAFVRHDRSSAWWIGNFALFLAAVAITFTAFGIVRVQGAYGEPFPSLSDAVDIFTAEAVILALYFSPGVVLYLWILKQMPKNVSGILGRVILVALSPICGVGVWPFAATAVDIMLHESIALSLLFGLVARPARNMTRVRSQSHKINEGESS